MPVLATVSDGEARRVGKAVRRAVYHLGYHRQRLHSPWSHAGNEEELGKVLEAMVLRVLCGIRAGHRCLEGVHPNHGRRCRASGIRLGAARRACTRLPVQTDKVRLLGAGHRAAARVFRTLSGKSDAPCGRNPEYRIGSHSRHL